MQIHRYAPLESLNTFGVSVRADTLIDIEKTSDLQQWLATATSDDLQNVVVLGGGSNIVFTQDVRATVLKIAIKGIRLLEETSKHFLIEVGAGELWSDVVAWSMKNGYFGLENMALIPGTAGAAPVQNIGAYGVELQDRFHSLEAFNLLTEKTFVLNAAQCEFGYRDSVFKRIKNNGGLKGQAVITKIFLLLPKPWKAVLNYHDIEQRMWQEHVNEPSAKQLYDWICTFRKQKLPDPILIGNAGSFFKNPIVTKEQCLDIIARDPKLVHYVLDDGRFKLAAGWLIEACGWKGKYIGRAGVFNKQSLILINLGGATGSEILTLSQAIQHSVYERFGLRLELEPVVV